MIEYGKYDEKHIEILHSQTVYVFFFFVSSSFLLRFMHFVFTLM